MGMKTKHGVIPGFLNTEETAKTAFEYGYTHLWSMSDEGYSRPYNHGEYSFQVSERHQKPATISVWKRGTGKLNIIFLNNTAWVEGTATFKDITFRELVEATGIIEQTLGVPMSGSPGGMGWALLKTIHPEWIEDVHSNLKELHFTPKAGPDLIWQRNISPEALGMFLVKVDKGGAYPAAATTTDNGVGTPVHLSQEESVWAARHEKGHPQRVGVWRCLVTGMAINEDMPPQRIPSGQYWLAGPRIRMLEAAGYSVEPMEAWVFPDQHDLLAKWAKFLWKARLEATNERARLAFKQIANTTIGFTAFKGFEDDDEKRRPDIRLQVVARHAEVMWHNLDKIRELYDVTPLMVYMDAAYYLCATPDGGAVVDEMTHRMGSSSGLGRFKYEGAIAITPEIQSMFERKMSVADRLEVLNKIGWAR